MKLTESQQDFVREAVEKDEFFPDKPSLKSFIEDTSTLTKKGLLVEALDGKTSEAKNGSHSHTEGHGTLAPGFCAHAEGFLANATGASSHAQGHQTQANGFASSATGAYTIADIEFSTAMGRYNNPNNPVEALTVGNGTYDARSNAFSVTFQGDIYGLSAFHGGGTSYAQMFEWFDKNPHEEDRIGYFVTLDHGKIKKVGGSFQYVLGVVTGTAAFVGNAADMNWRGMFLHDQWGRTMYDHQGLPWVNPDYDLSKQYAPRSIRPEWAPVAMVGQVAVRDDGSCRVNGYCQPNDHGVATNAEQGYFVMDRLADNQILIILK